MLKATYTESGLYLEYCPEPLDLLLSDRVCTCARAQQPISVQPIQANLPLPVHIAENQGLERFPALTVTRCDRDWLEITLTGLWLTEDPDQEVGIFLTELEPHLEQRIFRLWQIAQGIEEGRAIARKAA